MKIDRGRFLALVAAIGGVAAACSTSPSSNTSGGDDGGASSSGGASGGGSSSSGGASSSGGVSSSGNASSSGGSGSSGGTADAALDSTMDGPATEGCPFACDASPCAESLSPTIVAADGGSPTACQACFIANCLAQSACCTNDPNHGTINNFQDGGTMQVPACVAYTTCVGEGGGLDASIQNCRTIYPNAATIAAGDVLDNCVANFCPGCGFSFN